MRRFISVCFGVCALGALSSSAWAQARMYMTLPGQEGSVPPGPSNAIVIDAGETVSIEVFVENTSPQMVGAYQVGIPGTAMPTAAVGTVSYVNTAMGSVLINTADPTWIFNGIPGPVTSTSEVGLPTGFAFLAGLPIGQGLAVTTPRYLGEFQLQASGDAAGVFTLSFIPVGGPPHGGTFLIDQTGVNPVPFTAQSLVITVIGPPPANDDCSGQIAIPTGDTPFDTTNATTSLPNNNFGGPGNVVCNDNGDDTIENDLWFQHTNVCPGQLTVSTCDQAGFDTRLEVYRACNACPPPNQVACNDDAVDCDNGTSSVTFSALADTCYTIRVGGSTITDLGPGTLTITPNSCFIDGVCRTPGQVNPANECEVCDPTQSTTDWSPRPAGIACASDGEECTTDQCNGSGMCAHTPVTPGTPCADDGLECTLDECNASGMCAHPPVGAGMACTDDGDECTDDECDGAGTCAHPPAASGTPCTDDGEECTLDECDGAGMCAHPPAPPGTACDDGNPCTGTGGPGIGMDECDGAGMCVGMVDPNCQDTCADAAEALEGANFGNNTGFGTELKVSCSTSGADAWFVHTALCDGQLRINTIGSTFDAVLAVFDECDGAELACDDDSGPGADASITMSVMAGEDYFIRVAGFNGATGDIVLNINRIDTCRVDGMCFSAGFINPMNECEMCTPEDSVVDWSPVPKGTDCGNPILTDLQCDRPDACNGAGACEPNHKPAGTPCGDPTDTECDNADTCNGTGSCVVNLEPAGFPCGDPTATECNAADTCDGAGLCLANLVDAGTPCGDGTDTECDNPDTCDGLGDCQVNFEPDGTACPNGLFCDGDELCLGGLCEDQMDPCIDLAHCDEINGMCLECLDVFECGDVDPVNGVSDDNCLWYECADNFCNAIPRIYGDVGGAFGACPPDGFTNLFDLNHVLSCFAMTNPCEAINIDIGGPFGACPADGFCNLADANHVLSAFADTNPCTCPMDGPMPVVAAQTVGSTELLLQADRRSAAPGDLIRVRVLLGSSLNNLQSYQLSTVVSGGRSGALELVDVAIEPHPDYVFRKGEGFHAFSPGRSQMLSGLIQGGVKTGKHGYLATFTYRASEQASGKFVIDAVHGTPYHSLLVSSFVDRIEITGTQPAVIAIQAAEAGTR